MSLMTEIPEEQEGGYRLEQVGIRMVRERTLYSDMPISSPDAAIRVVADALLDYDREVFAIVNLQTDLRPINMNIISMGCLDGTLVHPREAVKSAVLSNAASVMIFHNHPSGRLQPSREDVATTDRMVQAFNLMGIPVLDHIIVGNDKSYYSFSEKSSLPIPKLSYTDQLDKLDLKKQKVAEQKQKPEQKPKSVLAKLNESKVKAKQNALEKSVTTKTHSGRMEL